MCDDHRMRSHGWSGDIPADDDEAVARLVTAALNTPEALLGATALSSINGFLDGLSAHLGSIRDPTEAVVEGIAYTFERLAHDKYLSLVFQPGKASAFATGVTSEVAISLGRSIVQRFDIDWPAAGFADDRLDELVEVMLRTLQSLILDPGRPLRTGASLRRFLADWISLHQRVPRPRWSILTLSGPSGRHHSRHASMAGLPRFTRKLQSARTSNAGWCRYRRPR